MKYTFTLRDTRDGKAVVYNEDYDWPDEHLMLFQWLDNNYSCDCNRWLFFTDGDDDAEDLPCSGSDNAIVIDRIADEHGVEINFKDSVYY